jgi:cellulose synthase/poly-beta-1,6-N-acetylglucosamine synthase-like glycosyltransferase
MNDVKISALCPTRKRPQNMERLTESLFSLASDPDAIEIIFYIDSDDEESLSKCLELEQKYNVRHIVGPRIVLSEMWNECWKVSKGDILFHCGDDLIFKTPDWEKEVLWCFSQIKDNIAFMFVNDESVQYERNFGTHGFIHKDWANAVGYFCPPYFSSDYNDTWFNDVSEIIRRKYKLKMVAEHMHPAFGKAEIDETHQDRLDRHLTDDVDSLYASKHEERVQDAKKLQKIIDEYSQTEAIINHED